jgi:hypothetical protein
MLKKNRIRDLTNLEVPDELKLENHERRPNNAVFDRIDLVIEFQSGKDNIGAIVTGYVDAILKHDTIVKEIELKMILIDEIKKSYRKKVRLFRNLDNTWNLIYTNPIEFTEYCDLLPKMKNIEKRLEMIDDIEVKSRLTMQYERFKLLEPFCSRQKIIYELYQKARKEKETVTKEYIEAEKHLNELKDIEKGLASLISDDHMIADDKGISLTDLFPNIHIVYILKKINQFSVENLPYGEVMKAIARSKSPHRIEVKRYDYRYNVFEKKWYSIDELRRNGVLIENPILRSKILVVFAFLFSYLLFFCLPLFTSVYLCLPAFSIFLLFIFFLFLHIGFLFGNSLVSLEIAFISAAAKGEIKIVRQYIAEGEDPNCTDLTGNTAIVAAAVNKHIEVVELLHEKGGNINCRDKNAMTPLLYVITRGYQDLVRLLLAYGADKTCVDRNAHDCFYYAILSNNLILVKMFYNSIMKNAKEKLWGFTPLHIAANNGSMSVVEFLLTEKCSIYQLDYKNKTAEEIAKIAKHYHIEKRLSEERINACGQCIYYDKEKQFQLWIGDSSCLEMEWIIDLDFNAIIYFHQEERVPLPAQWLQNQGKYKDNIKKLTQQHQMTLLPGSPTKKTLLIKNGNESNKTSNSSPRKSTALVVLEKQNEIEEEEELSDIDEPKENSKRKSSISSSSTPAKQKKSQFLHIKTSPTKKKSATAIAEEDEDDDDEELHRAMLNNQQLDEIAFHPFYIPIDPDEGDNADQWKELQEYIPSVMDILPFYHLHANEELLARQSSYSTIANSVGGDDSDNQSTFSRKSLLSQITSLSNNNNNNNIKSKTTIMKKVLICDDHGNSLSPAMAMTYLLLKQSMRVDETIEKMKECRPSVEVGPTIRKGLQQLQYKYDEKVLQRLNQRLRGSVVTSVAF